MTAKTQIKLNGVRYTFEYNGADYITIECYRNYRYLDVKLPVKTYTGDSKTLQSIIHDGIIEARDGAKGLFDSISDDINTAITWQLSAMLTETIIDEFVTDEFFK